MPLEFLGTIGWIETGNNYLFESLASFLNGENVHWIASRIWECKGGRSDDGICRLM